ncbi:hypothetical protein H5410_049250 [Solanum commersonii]|uniref:Uncharacterized protein n=1 Tax=Solanum commersonii TaxID=4109 RepID=A0A9J5XP04_SOLCO|nr:hypothetical protein H5410_049250 [Solanum commersonii]
MATPSVIAGHPLRPAPNGINSKFCPLKSISLFRNLSGINSFEFSHISGSLAIAQNVDFFIDSPGRRSGADGYNRNVSFITALR